MIAKLQAENEAQIQFYRGRNKWAFDEIQKILDKKAKGDLSIDLDIQQKIFNQVHSDGVKAYNFAESIKRCIEDALQKSSEVEDE